MIGVPRLFWKVYGWLLLSLTIFFVVGAINFNIVRNRIQRHERREGRMRDLQLHARTCQEALRSHGLDAALAMLRVGHSTARFEAWMLRSDLTSVDDSLPPHHISELTFDDLPRSQEIDGLHFYIDELKGGDESYYYLASRRGRRGNLFGPRPWHIVHHVTLVCIGLFILGIPFARSITKPIVALGQSVCNLARGELDERSAKNISSRRDELGQLARDFDNMADRVQELLTAQRRFVRDAAHELRSPLARIAVALELARSHTTEAGSDALLRLESETNIMNALVEDLLTLARLESADLQPAREQIDLVDALRLMVDNAAFEAQPKGVTISLECPDQLPLAAQPQLLPRALENVLRNAIQHAPSNSSVEVAATHSNQDELTIAFRDHGPGIPEDVLEKIFQPFFRVSHGRERSSGGTGIGLAIASEVVRHHGGQLTAQNCDDGGMLFQFILPSESA